MGIRKTFVTSKRVLSQLRHDRRTLALVFIVPPVLLTILKYVFHGELGVFDSIAPMLLGIFPMTMMFLITSIVTLRERSSGTLNRLMTMPISKFDFIFGYAIAFCLLGLVQALISGGVMLGLLHVAVIGGTISTMIVAVLAAFLGTALGLFTSAFARSEFQAVQFLPAFILPQLLMCGLFVARSEMAKPLQWFADILPLTYSVDAMKQVTFDSSWTGILTRDLTVVACFAIVALILGATTIRRQE
jgi:ABC-2 type transport system permease protein